MASSVSYVEYPPLVFFPFATSRCSGSHGTRLCKLFRTHTAGGLLIQVAVTLAVRHKNDLPAVGGPQRVKVIRRIESRALSLMRRGGRQEDVP